MITKYLSDKMVGVRYKEIVEHDYRQEYFLVKINPAEET